MKSRNLIFGLFIIAAIGLFTSCEETDPIGPSLDFFGGDYVDEDVTVEPGATIVFSWQAEQGDNKLESFSISKDGSYIVGWSNKSIDKADNEIYNDTAAITVPLTEGMYTYEFTVTDKDGGTASESFVITVEETITSTPLTGPSTFTLIYKSSSQSDGDNENGTVGIEYASNVDGNTANFATISGDFVIISESDYNTIDTKEALVAAFDAGSVVESFTAKSDANFTEKYFISKVSDSYYLVKMTDLTFAPGDNQADFEFYE